MLSFGCGSVELRFDDHIKLTEIVVFRKVTRDVVKYLEDLYRRTGIKDIRDVIRDFNLVLERGHEFSGVEREYIISKAIEKLDKVRFEIHRKLEEWLRRVGVPEGFGSVYVCIYFRMFSSRFCFIYVDFIFFIPSSPLQGLSLPRDCPLMYLGFPGLTQPQVR